jgi:hypothetical protein
MLMILEKGCCVKSLGKEPNAELFQSDVACIELV